MPRSGSELTTSRLHSLIMAKVSHAFNHLGAVLLTVGRSYVGNDVTNSTLLDRACACSYENLPKYRSYRVGNTAPWPWRRSTIVRRLQFEIATSRLRSLIVACVLFQMPCEYLSLDRMERWMGCKYLPPLLLPLFPYTDDSLT